MKRTGADIRYSKAQADAAARDLYGALLKVVSKSEEVLEYSAEIPGGYKLSGEDRAMLAKAVGLLFDLNCECGQ